MKTTFKIAKTELQKLFYSPVAWLILAIFVFQVAMVFNDVYQSMVRNQSLGYPLFNATLNTFGGMRGMFTAVQSYLFLYIPLVTMNIMSRELGSGSIKLLYSSPLTNRQIILGKYFALVGFGLALVLVLAVFGTFAALTIDKVDIPVILCGLLGIFLLICAYSAIGLFVSSLTSYTVVAAMGTLGIFALLNYVKDVGQEIEIVRDITFWLAISGRAATFVQGLITSEDLLYFLIVIGMFLAFTIIRLQSGRVKTTWMANTMKYLGVFALAMTAGYFSAQPKLMGYLDVTHNKANTLTKASQEVMSKLDDDLTITTYSNMLGPHYGFAMPQNYKNDVSMFRHYIRFKPDIKMKYKFYYHKTENEHLDRQFPTLDDKQRMDTLRKLLNIRFPVSSYDDIKDEVDLEPEKFRFVRLLERANGKRTFLRIFDDGQVFPSEAEISAAMKRITMDDLPVIGFLTGHGERSSTNSTDRGYKIFAQEKTFRYALINQGFDFANISLDKPVPSNIRTLVIAELRSALTEAETVHLNEYINRGGNLVIAGEPGRNEYMSVVTDQIGVRFVPGILVKPTEDYQPDLMLLRPTRQAREFSYIFAGMARRRAVLTMPRSGAVEVAEDKGFKITPLFTTDSSGSWNEIETTDLIDDTAVYNPAVEVKKPYITVMAMSRMVNGKEQKIVVTGDADWMSNAELSLTRPKVNAGNFTVISAVFGWMADGEVPIDMRRDQPRDRALKIGEDGWNIWNIMLKWVFPGLLAVAGILIWIRRRGR